MGTGMEDGMARMVGRLTQKEVANAKPTAERKATLLADGGNLYLQCTRGKDGTILRSWVFRYELDERRREMGLGPLSTISLSEARDRASSLRKQLLDDIDPLEAKRRARLARLAEQAKTVTFKRCAEMYLEAHRDGWKNAKHRWQWTSTLERYVYPVIGDLAVSDVDTNLVIKIVEPIWKTIPETASRIRGRVEVILGYATVRGFRTGDNPARWRGHLAEVLRGSPKAEHHPAMPFAEMAAFMERLRGRLSISARALEFTILTAARTGETLGATWDELDLKTGTWVVLAARMKGGKEHRVPLSGRAVAILKGIAEQAGRAPSRRHVFANGERPLSNMAMLQLLRGMHPDLTVHGFRSSFRDWAAETTNHPNHVVEMALAHAVGNDVEAAYRRGDLFLKRRRLMEAWADYCGKPVAAVGDLKAARAS
jgi:integrase